MHAAAKLRFRLGFLSKTNNSLYLRILLQCSIWEEEDGTNSQTDGLLPGIHLCIDA
jgi:hypothetical protein